MPGVEVLEEVPSFRSLPPPPLRRGTELPAVAVKRQYRSRAGKRVLPPSAITRVEHASLPFLSPSSSSSTFVYREVELKLIVVSILSFLEGETTISSL